RRPTSTLFPYTTLFRSKANAYGLVRANDAGITTQVLSHKTYASRDRYDEALIDAIDQHQPDLVVLAGFMRILTPAFVQHYVGRLDRKSTRLNSSHVKIS